MDFDKQEIGWWELVLWSLVVGLIGRIVTVWILTGYPLAQQSTNGPKRSFRTVIVLGSGGHTAEILNVVKALSFRRYHPRCYIAAITDNHSIAKAQRMEEAAASGKNSWRYYQIYRSREVGQSYVTSVGSTLLAIAHAFWLIFYIRPDVILCNGPGTCLPICIAGFVLKVLGVKWVVMVYVESIARVQKLSLTGLLFYRLYLMDVFVVQWPKLQQSFPRTQYFGHLM